MSEECTASNARTVRARICFSDELPPECGDFELPGDRMMMEIELEHLTLLVLRPGSMDRRLYDEWNRYLDRITTLGIWSRDPSRSGVLGMLRSVFAS
ncbi:hypothetical protein [Streptomyces dubilierae]|uniref:Uncharacterized protein n=1 Tax=Streptomyces dubilierae TaxID=3075533 RepID=A0ABU2P6V4_9ACTN|nr:hypothetical protein [Streptomyces sp. DSM 41921]MDT0387883.1 hypothetical protein [Streptomyces sp. DSM 41921]